MQAGKKEIIIQKLQKMLNNADVFFEQKCFAAAKDNYHFILNNPHATPAQLEEAHWGLERIKNAPASSTRATAQNWDHVSYEKIVKPTRKTSPISLTPEEEEAELAAAIAEANSPPLKSPEPKFEATKNGAAPTPTNNRRNSTTGGGLSSVAARLEAKLITVHTLVFPTNGHCPNADDLVRAIKLCQKIVEDPTLTMLQKAVAYDEASHAYDQLKEMRPSADLISSIDLLQGAQDARQNAIDAYQEALTQPPLSDLPNENALKQTINVRLYKLLQDADIFDWNKRENLKPNEASDAFIYFESVEAEDTALVLRKIIAASVSAPAPAHAAEPLGDGGEKPPVVNAAPTAEPQPVEPAAIPVIQTALPPKNTAVTKSANAIPAEVVKPKVVVNKKNAMGNKKAAGENAESASAAPAVAPKNPVAKSTAPAANGPRNIAPASAPTPTAAAQPPKRRAAPPPPEEKGETELEKAFRERRERREGPAKLATPADGNPLAKAASTPLAAKAVGVATKPLSSAFLAARARFQFAAEPQVVPPVAKGAPPKAGANGAGAPAHKVSNVMNPG